MKGDDIVLSPSYSQDTCYINITMTVASEFFVCVLMLKSHDEKLRKTQWRGEVYTRRLVSVHACMNESADKTTIAKFQL